MFEQETAERDSDDRAVMVRHVPIVIEREDTNADNSDTVVRVDERSSPSSISSESSVESARRRDSGRGDAKYYSWDDWRERRRARQGKDHNDCNSLKKESKKVLPEKRIQESPRLSSPGPGPWYLLRSEKVGVESCPVHGDGEVARARKPLSASQGLSTPAMLASLPGNKTSTMGTGRRPKHQSLPASGTTSLRRGPGQWSVRGDRGLHNSDKNDTFRERNEDKKNPSVGFQRRWSFRASSLTPTKNPKDTSTGSSSSNSMSFQAPTIASLSRCVTGAVPEYFKLSVAPEEETINEAVRRYSSHSDLNSGSTQQKLQQLRTSPSVSTISTLSKISPDRESDCSNPPTGILKTPGKRKVSSNNRVEFLSNIMEREIPGRYT